MGTRHTPGPWTLKTPIVKGAAPTVYGPSAQQITPIVAIWSGKNADADARLISSAPDLLEALQSFMASHVSSKPFDRPCNCQWCAKGKDAIARATGQESEVGS